MTNIIYDPKIKELLCSKCKDIAKWNTDGDLECTNSDCRYVYKMFEEKKNNCNFEHCVLFK